ncbi:helix-turn-helix transcriptional regulator [Metabacillus fastidiosus]|uniref:helix-turn-helix transcriptional regulator n=1 Tax=Metabacillus fastidiosus TaxID=1458 RepID=UPI003D28B9A6
MRIWLKEIRTVKNLTQLDVAIKAKIERSYYTMIEAGNRKPSVNVAKAIANVLEFDWTNFFNEKCNESLLYKPVENKKLNGSSDCPTGIS